MVCPAHGLRAGLCDPLDGIELYALGPGFGSVAGGVWGAVAGLVAERVASGGWRSLVAVTLALLGPLGTIAVSLWRFLSSAMVFAYDPFFGFFAGPIYDSVQSPLFVLATYRAGTVLSLLTTAALSFHLRRNPAGRLSWRRIERPAIALAGVLAFSGSIGITLAGPELGHYSTTQSIRAVLWRTLSGERCDVIFSSGLLERDVSVLSHDCDAHIRELEKFFETRGPDRITVYLFASSGEKGRLMGASSTYIAKPWRKEIYLQTELYPHPVLGHELAHVIAGSFASGPFRVAGSFRGWIPDPGLIEGVAVAASPPESSDLTLQQWSSAMAEIGLLPRLGDLFDLSFLTVNAPRAYTVAGAFIEWFRDRYGAQALRAWYAGTSLEKAAGKSLSVLESEWHASLRAVRVSPQALYAARARFDRPAIFQQHCAHTIDELNGIANGRLGGNDYRGARVAFQQLLELDPHHFGARMGLAQCAMRAGRETEAQMRFRNIARAADLTRIEKAAAMEALGDMALRSRQVREADAWYAQVQELTLDEDALRTLDVKANPPSELGRRAIVSLLVGDARLGPSWDVAAAELGEWLDQEPEQGLPAYLLGKNLYNRGRWEEAARYLDQSLGRRLDLPRVRREALRTRLTLACALSDRDIAREMVAALETDRELVEAQRAGIRHLARRCGLQ
jgi:tetratricopeptide (TPR) repeat protein